MKDQRQHMAARIKMLSTPNSKPSRHPQRAMAVPTAVRERSRQDQTSRPMTTVMIRQRMPFVLRVEGRVRDGIGMRFSMLLPLSRTLAPRTDTVSGISAPPDGAKHRVEWETGGCVWFVFVPGERK